MGFVTVPFALADAQGPPGLAQTPTAPGPHASPTDPIEIVLEGPAEIQPGAPIEIVARITATWTDVTGADLTLDLSRELRRTGPPLRTLELEENVEETVTFRLQTAEDGVHAFTLSVKGDSDLGTLGGSRQGFVLAEDDGPGEFTQDLPPGQGDHFRADTAEPSGTAPRLATTPDGTWPGPAVRARNETSDDLTSENGSEDGPSLQSHSTFQVKVCWFYRNEADTADIAQRLATVEVWDDDTGSDQLLDVGVTGTDGCFTSADIPREEGHCCSTGNQDVYVRIHLCNTWACVHDGDQDFWRFRVDIGTVGTQDLIDLGSLKPASASGLFAQRQFQYGNNAASIAVNFVNAAGFSSSGPQVTVEAPSDDGGCPGMFFRLGEDRIYVCSGRDRSPDDLGHEYGHFLQDKLYGDSFWPSPNGPHNLCDDNQDRGLSWTEGFGNWYGPFVDWQAGAPGASGDISYNRPWDGSSFSFSMESANCGAVAGDDNEINVASTIWDMVDGATDGADTSDTTSAFLVSVVSSCDDNNLRDLYDGGSCTWQNQGGDPCNLVPAAFQNNVDFNDNTPVGTMTSQGSFTWVRGTISVSASISDADGFGCPLSGDFYLSHNSACTGSDVSIGLDTLAPFSRTFDTSTVPDDGSVWTCVLTSDGMEQGTGDTSAQFGIDNTEPNVGLSASGTFQNGWFSTTPTLTLGCGDNLSGVDEIEYVVDALGPLQPYTGPFQITGEGEHTLIMSCTDNAGNTDVDFETIRIDTVDPSTTSSLAGTLGENGWYTSPVQVSLTCTDPTPGSGCLATQIQTGEGIFNCGCPFTISEDGMHEVHYHSTDVAGNVDPTGMVSFDIDQVAPNVTLTGASDGAFSYNASEVLDGVFTNAANLNVSYEAADATSGVMAVRASGVEDTFAPLTSPVNGTLEVALPEGLSTVELVAEDQAGHLSTIVSFEVVSVQLDASNSTVDPQGAGFWANAVDTGKYTSEEISGFLALINVVSTEYGAGDTFGEVNTTNYKEILELPKPPKSDDKVSRSLLTAWLNLVSGREPAGQSVDLSSVASWEDVVKNTDGSPITTALNTVEQAEVTYETTSPKPLKNAVKDVLSALNSGDLNI